MTGGVLALLPLALPAAANPYQTINVSLASGPSPFASCDISGDVGTNYLDTEVEPWVAVDPNDSNHLVAVWQQDRWNNGGARGLMTGVSFDGGLTWPVQTFAHFSKCSGGTPANGGDFDRASDPWVTISPNGDVYQIALSISFVSATESAVLVSKSTDGGVSWGEPVTLARDDFTVGAQLFHDKESITADPLDSNFVYAVWDRSRFPSDQGKPFGGFPHSFRGDIMFARTTDGGQTWEPARAIFQPQANEASIGHIIAVIPDGTLVDIFDRLKGSGNNRPGFDIAVVRSTDRGVTWSSPLHVADELALGVRDPDTGFPVRAGVGLPDIAADLNPSSPGYGNLYAVWGDGFSKQATHNGIAFTMSTDGGLTWTPITRISKTDPSIDAFTPAIDVASDGTVGVAYY
ncbi:MAG TPA: sialidase family protein, partial [Actinomycetota bacterium]